MKPAKEKRLRLVGSKKWTRAELESSSENFHFMWAKDWPLHHLPIAWAWELDRELGSGNLPFIIAWKNKFGDTEPDDEIKPAARFLQLEDEELRELYPFNPDGNRYNMGLPEYHCYAVKINLRRTDDEILADLKKGIQKFKRNISSLKHQPTRGQQRRDYIAWFRDLAIYRMSVAGIRTKEQMNLLPGEMVTIKAGDFQNWRHKHDATKKRIAERLHILKLCAECAGVGQDRNPRPNLPFGVGQG